MEFKSNVDQNLTLTCVLYKCKSLRDQTTCNFGVLRSVETNCNRLLTLPSIKQTIDHTSQIVLLMFYYICQPT